MGMLLSASAADKTAKHLNKDVVSGLEPFKRIFNLGNATENITEQVTGNSGAASDVTIIIDSGSEGSPSPLLGKTGEAEEDLDGLLKEIRRTRQDVSEIAQELNAISKRYTVSILASRFDLSPGAFTLHKVASADSDDDEGDEDDDDDDDDDDYDDGEDDEESARQRNRVRRSSDLLSRILRWASMASERTKRE